MLGLIADDLTGACDTAAQFLAGGRVLVATWPVRPGWPGPAGSPGVGIACAAISTDSRAEDRAEGTRRTRAAVELLLAAGADRFFLKIDSRLQGHVAGDLGAALSVTGGPAVVCPALPAEQRVTIGGVQRWPGGEVNLAELLPGAVPVTPATIAGLRPGAIGLADAGGDPDLDALAAALLPVREVLPVGSAGLGAALGRVLGGERPEPPSPGCRRPIALIGTPAADVQGLFAAGRGWRVCRLGKSELPEAYGIDLSGFDCLFITGGSTVARILRRHRAEGIELFGQAAPRVPWGRVLGGDLHGRMIVVKSGSFGGEEVVDQALTWMRGS